MKGSRVELPPGVRTPFTVHVNAVRQQEGSDYVVEDRTLIFERELVKGERLGLWRWFLGAWGIGDYRRNDQIDVSWDDAGRPRMVHALDVEPPAAGATPGSAPRSTAPSS